MNYAIDTGSGERRSPSHFNPTLADSVLPGTPLRVKAAVTNTGPCVMIVDGVQHPLRKMDGSELEANEIIGGGVFESLWNGSGYWSMTNFLGLGGSGGGGTSNTYITKIPYAKDTSATANHLVAAFSPAITTMVPGDAIEVWLKNNITGPTDIVVNALPAKAIVRPNGAPLISGDAVAGQVMLLVLGEDGQFQFFGIIPSFAGLACPIGSVIIALGNAAPAGTLKLNGAMLVRAEHPLLWTYANSTGRLVDDSVWTNNANHNWAAFSRGDGTTTFRLPDFRGEGLRCFDDTRGIDVGRQITQQQADAIGALNFSGNATLINPIATIYSGGDANAHIPEGLLSIPFGESLFDQISEGNQTIHHLACWDNQAVASGASPQRGGQITGQWTITGTGGANETRMRNVAIMACVVDG